MKNLPSRDLDHILNHTRDFWEEVRGERIFITGGTGFFGHWLLESFLWINQRLKLNSRVTVLTRSPDTFIAKTPHLALADGVSLVPGDIRTFDFPEGMFSHVIHAATEANAKLNAENPLLILNTIVDGTRRTLDFSLTCGAKKILLTSSGAVYGKQPPAINHILEDYLGGPDPLEAGSAYGEGKRMAEMLCSLYAHQFGIEVKIARCFAFVGPYLPLDAHFAIGNFIRDGLNGDPIVVQGDGTPQRSYLYAADLAIWLWTILFRGQSCRPYNVGSEESITIRALAETVKQAFQPEPLVHVLKKVDPDRAVEHYVPSTKRAFNELNLTKIIGLEDAITRTISWTKGE